jgi:hypothetical protein
MEIHSKFKVKNDEETKLYFLNSESVESDVYFEGLKKANIKNQDIINSEKINLDISEVVDIDNDGSANLDITMEISSNKLINLYKESLGITNELSEVDMEIPEQTNRKISLELDDGTTIDEEYTEPVRERFLDGIIEEQKFLYGIFISEFRDTRIYSSNLNEKLCIYIKAKALLHITDISEEDDLKTLTIQSAPKETINNFVNEQIELSKVMLQSFTGIQVFTKKVDINFILPQSVNILNFENKEKFFDFGSASFSTDLKMSTKNQISLSEEWNVCENKKSREENEIESLYIFKYEIESTEEMGDILKSDYDFDMSTFSDEPWSFSRNFDLITLEDNEGDLTYSIDVDFYLSLSGGLHVDLGKALIYAEFGLIVGLEVDATISGQYENTFNLFGGMSFAGNQYSWRGIQPLAIFVHVKPEAKLYVSVEGSVHIYLNPEADFSLKAGGDLDFVWAWPPVHFTPIFDYSLGGHFDKSIDISCEATIKPSLGFAISLLVFEIIGPRITPTVYLEGTFGYDSNEGAYWKAELGFDLYVGIQFTPFIHWNWPESIYNAPLAKWKGSFNPGDNNPPTTSLYMSPKVNGYVGPLAIFWFKAKDNGPEGEGISETKFKIPEATDNSWHTFDYSLLHLIITNVENYNVKYYSIDTKGNQENTKTKSVQADLTRPDIGLDFSGEYYEIGDDEYEIKKDETKLYLVGREKGSRRTNVRVWFKATHESGFEIEWKITDFKTGSDWYGWELTFEDLGEWTVEWVAEDGVWNLRYYKITVNVVNQFIEPSIQITSPKRGDIRFGSNYFGNLGFSMAIFLLTSGVSVTAETEGNGIDYVRFECDGRRVTDETPNGNTYSGNIKAVSGKETLYAKAFDKNGELLDSDTVPILKLGGS